MELENARYRKCNRIGGPKKTQEHGVSDERGILRDIAAAYGAASRVGKFLIARDLEVRPDEARSEMGSTGGNILRVHAGG